MRETYNPWGPGRAPDNEEKEKNELLKKHFVPTDVKVDAILRSTPATDEEVSKLISSPKDASKEDSPMPEKGEPWLTYIGRLSSLSKTPNYKSLLVEVAKRDDLPVDGYWDRMKASAAKDAPPPVGAGVQQPVTGAAPEKGKSDERKTWK